jgi:hypothetical protein
MAARFDWAVPTILGNNDEPVQATDAATKDYVDNALANVSGSSISNGTSNVSIESADGGVNFNLSGNVGTLVIAKEGNNNANIISSGGGNILITARNLIPDGNLTVAGNASAGNISTGGALSVTGNASAGNISTGGALSVTGNASAGNISTGGALSVTGNASAGNISTAGNITVAGPSSLIIPGGTIGDVLSTDGAGNISWLNIGAISQFAGASQAVGANSTVTISWSVVNQNDIGLTLSTIGGTANGSISYSGSGTLVLGITWRVVWNTPTTQTGARRAFIRENSNNKDVIVAGPITGIPCIVQQTTTILTLSSTSGGIDIGCENYGSDSCTVGGATTPTSDFYLAPSNLCTITLLGKI